MTRLLGLLAALCLASTASAGTVSVRDPWPASALGSVNPDVFEMALAAASCAERAGAVDQPATLTVIDYSLPSTTKRMWVYDLRSHRLLYEELVSHGQGSGENVARRFSNVPESYQTSLGLFVTAEPYVGKNGYSLRLDGLEAGINDRARERAIVMHGAPYVSPQFVAANGRLGRSQGCPAVRNEIARGLIDTVKGGGLVFAYAKDPVWLRSSAYLGQCAAAQMTALPRTAK
jgi:L,D-transpeptidase catalytic domain